ncbi:hypothetical protein FOL47_002984 [Perkinsus chesapeaki]|uniref:Uncharacterized protein n=1 Tax=Perkinsus chesapeaki TaxID=330153 RepID=A0A7J6MA92_PERCH|nr:hypothetical protein FOL47_002984 [Perkinsus chesapeaki]
MRLTVKVLETSFDIEIGKGCQHARWLGLVAADKYAELTSATAAFLIPTLVKTNDGRVIKPRQAISEMAADGDTIIVDLSIRGDVLAKAINSDHSPYPHLKPAAGGSAKVFETLGVDDNESRRLTEWREEAYGPKSGLIKCLIRWIPGRNRSDEPPTKVVGHYMVHEKWLPLYPQVEFGGPFEIPLKPLDAGDGAGYHWDAILRGPPGTAVFKFVLPDGTKVICESLPVIGNEDDEPQNILEFKWDAAVCDEPDMDEIDKATSASSGGADKDPRFIEDWEKLKLSWLNTEERTKVKDVLVEFYDALIDLFDSYAFMGVDGGEGNREGEGSSEGNTIGVDDFKHLLMECSLLDSSNVLNWGDVKLWLVEMNPALFSMGRACLQQRLERYQYLELLVKSATKVYGGEGGVEDAVFGFIRDVLLPVMDAYDDDYIRKLAVEKDNLIVLQMVRAKFRSLHSLLQRPWAYEDDEMLVAPDDLKFVLKSCIEAYFTADDDENDLQAADGSRKADILGIGEKLEPEHVETMLEVFDGLVGDILNKRAADTDKSAMYFWDFFELLMYLCDSIKSTIPLHEAIPKAINTMTAMVGHMTANGVDLPR